MKAIKLKKMSAFQSLAPDELKAIRGGENSGEESGTEVYDCTCYYSIFNQGSFHNLLGTGEYAGSSCQEACESYCAGISGAISPVGFKTLHLY